ncbi:hypothetical protein IV203_023755 [Nitzschia inconspicua]|uniref:Uncharacterized protein n=1 Tax=Nitzschia inconspicua TaxID=303405 RepID=A0A9K3PAF3_9STRA|nr:hypothetical protein IV203_023755 [Nitzschia inconspicua]
MKIFSSFLTASLMVLFSSYLYVGGQETGFGCYNLPGVGRACTCTDEYCTESKCVAADGIWTDGCLSCQCGSNDPGDASNTPKVPGTGCYGMTSNPFGCTCTETACLSPDACSVLFGGVWSKECLSCRCEDLVENDTGDDLDDFNLSMSMPSFNMSMSFSMSMSMSMSMPPSDQRRRLRS